MIEWEKIEKTDVLTINRIVKRATKHHRFTDALSLNMDISAVHIKTPLNLDKLEFFDDFNFAHDVCGIYRHVDRATGELMNCFAPRCG